MGCQPCQAEVEVFYVSCGEGCAFSFWGSVTTKRDREGF